MTVSLESEADALEPFDAAPRQFNKSLIVVLFVNLLAQSLVCWSVFSFAPFMILDYGLVVHERDAGEYAGYLAGIFLLTSVPSCLAFGWLADRIGRRKCLLINSALGGIFYIAFSFSPSFGAALSLRGVAGLFSAAYPIAKCVVNDAFSQVHKAQAFAVITASWGAGALVGPALSGVLARPAVQYADSFGKDGFFGVYPYALQGFVIGGYVILATLLTWWKLPETLVRKSTDKPTVPLAELGEALMNSADGDGEGGDGKGDGDGVPEPVASKPAPLERGVSAALSVPTGTVTKRWQAASIEHMSDKERNKLIARCVVAFSMMCFITSVRDETLPLLAMTDVPSGGWNFSTAQIGIALSLLGIFLLAAQVLYFLAVKRFGPLVLFRAALLVYAPTMAMWPALGPISAGQPEVIWPGIVLVSLLSSASNSFCFTSANVLMNTSAGASRSGRVNGVASAICSLLAAIAPFVSSPAFSWSANAGLTWIVFVCCAVATIMCEFLTIGIPRSLG